MTTRNAADVAKILGCSARKVRAEAKRHRIGINLGGSAGFRFTDADVEALLAALRLTAAAPRRERPAHLARRAS